MSLKLADVDRAGLTPSMAQYAEMKAAHPEGLLFFQMGDFFELFFEDAVIVSEALGLALTHRGRAGGKPIPMCGVPVHASEMYAAKLLEQGHVICLCTQTEAPNAQTKLLKRAVEKVLTPGTATEDFLLPAHTNNFLLSVAPSGKHWGLCLLDTSTGDVHIEQTDDSLLKTNLFNRCPKEILLPFEHFENDFLAPIQNLYKGKVTTWPDLRFKQSLETLHEAYSGIAAQAIKKFSTAEKTALSTAISYAQNVLGQNLFLKIPEKASETSSVRLDLFTRQNLELTQTSSENKKACLLHVMDWTRTPMGKRLMAKTVAAPSRCIQTIENRLDAVSFFFENKTAAEHLEHILKSTPDLERSLVRICMKGTSPQDLGRIRDALEKISDLRAVFHPHRNNFPNLLREAFSKIPEDLQLGLKLSTLLQQNMPPKFQPGFVIQSGQDAALDSLRQEKKHANQQIEALELHYKTKLGISSLKIRSNNLIGHYIEVPKRFTAQVPECFKIRQGLAQMARFTSPELKSLEERLSDLSAKESAHENQLFESLLEEVRQLGSVILGIAEAIGTLDHFSALGVFARSHRYVRPEVTNEKVLEITGGRHPVVENFKVGSKEPFTANNTQINASCTLKLITAPNMAGKSTYLRQNALITLMAQMGAFVPAQHARIGITDAVFSRLGASDDLSSGHSTFMVEMLETSHILKHATPQSLVILDEVGRGTSATEGLAIAKACLLYLLQNIGCRTFFATHYFELTDLQTTYPGIQNYTFKVSVNQQNILFLHEITKGYAESSYSLYVAKMAGIPDSVLDRAKRFHQNQEDTLAGLGNKDILQELQALDMENTSPKTAWDILFNLKNQAVAKTENAA